MNFVYGKWSNEKQESLDMKAWQLKGLREGTALSRHIATHGGAEDPECPACEEIKLKMERERG